MLGAKIFEYYAGAVGNSSATRSPSPRAGSILTLRQPLGVVAAIVPWNFPFPIAC
jgi:acyl-CoA reductase-like NAD-dependent aldehyde dehydrogenase